MLDVRFQPLTKWEGAQTRARFNSPFKAGYIDTLDKLEKELKSIQARNLVIHAAFTLGDLRNDGWPYAGRQPSMPGIVVSFDSQHGPLQLKCDRFRKYEDNLRAIMYHLEHLRMASLYGVGTEGQAYKGWLQLECPEMSRQAAADVIGRIGGIQAASVLRAPKESIPAALLRAHPDNGGSMELLQQVYNARKVLIGEERLAGV